LPGSPFLISPLHFVASKKRATRPEVV
jgi:hypothetical protein